MKKVFVFILILTLVGSLMPANALEFPAAMRFVGTQTDNPDPEVSADPDPEVSADPDPEVSADPDPEVSADPDPEALNTVQHFYDALDCQAWEEHAVLYAEYDRDWMLNYFSNEG